jgi:hypothetical protein
MLGLPPVLHLASGERGYSCLRVKSAILIYNLNQKPNLFKV